MQCMSSSLEREMSAIRSFPKRRQRRRLLVVAPDWTRAPYDTRLPLGHASLVAAAQAHPGIETTARRYDLTRPGFDVDVIINDVLAWASQGDAESNDVAIGVYVWNDAVVHRIALALRMRGFKGRIILGGPQISNAPPGVAMLYPEADCMVRGFGELALPAIAATDERIVRPGVIWRGGPDPGECADIDLTQVPSPHLSGVLPVEAGRRVRWETQRGCLYRCAYCQHRGPGSRPFRAVFPLDRLMDEIALFSARRVGSLDILDPIFNTGPYYLKIFEEFARRRFRACISLQCRFELVSPEFVELLSRLDSRPEFGLQTIHADEARAVHRALDLDSAERTMAELSRRRVRYVVTLIYGLPEQTLASFRASVAFCLERRVPVVRAFPLSLLRGTELERNRSRWDLVTRSEGPPYVIRSNTFDERDHEEMERIAAALGATEGVHGGTIEECLDRMPSAA